MTTMNTMANREGVGARDERVKGGVGVGGRKLRGEESVVEGEKGAEDKSSPVDDEENLETDEREAEVVLRKTLAVAGEQSILTDEPKAKVRSTNALSLSRTAPPMFQLIFCRADRQAT